MAVVFVARPRIVGERPSPALALARIAEVRVGGVESVQWFVGEAFVSRFAQPAWLKPFSVAPYGAASSLPCA